MQRLRRLLPTSCLAAVLLVLAACGAETPPPTGSGATTPRLRIIQPRDGARFGIWDVDRELGWVAVLFDLDDPTGEHRIRFAVGDGAPTEVRDRHRALVRKPARGSHVLKAWLIDAEGAPLDDPGARDAVTIVVGR